MTYSPAGVVKPPMSQRNKLIAALAICLGLLTILGIGLTVTAFANSRESPTTAPAIAASTSDDWNRAVCRTGSFYNGANILSNSTGSAVCSSVTANAPLGIATYSSRFALENDIAVFGGGRYAETTTNTGEIYVFVPLRGGNDSDVRKDLSRLEKFGFENRQVPRS